MHCLSHSTFLHTYHILSLCSLIHTVHFAMHVRVVQVELCIADTLAYRTHSCYELKVQGQLSCRFSHSSNVIKGITLNPCQVYKIYYSFHLCLPPVYRCTAPSPWAPCLTDPLVTGLLV